MNEHPTSAEIAAKFGVSERQARRMRAAGDPRLTPLDITYHRAQEAERVRSAIFTAVITVRNELTKLQSVLAGAPCLPAVEVEVGKIRQSLDALRALTS